MKLSLNWLRDFVEIPKKYSGKELGKMLTLHTAEVENVIDYKKAFEGVVIGELLEIQKHPDADKLSIAKVDIGKKEPIQLIFGQMVDMKVGNRVPVAVAPTTLPTGMVIEKRKMRGVVSEGMLCLDQELGLKAEGVSIQFFDKKVAPGTPFAEAAGLDEVVLEIENKSLTHRPDLWGHYGFARELSALLDQKLEPYEKATKCDKLKIPSKGESVEVKIESKEIAKRFCAGIITNVKVEESPEWMKKRLESCGIRPINNIVDITNYVMLDLGQPMHAFDRKNVGTDLLDVRFAKKDEKLKTIDHVKRTLDPEDIVISNGKKLLGLGGIIGGADSEISEKTTDVIFVAENWNPTLLRKSSQRQCLRTEAVQRFEKSLDPEMCELAMHRAYGLLLEMCKDAKIAGPITDIKNGTITLPKIEINFSRVQGKIGAEISEKEAKKHLISLGFLVEEPFTVTVPSWRATKDISIEADIVEEIARMHGYDNIPSTLPSLPTKAPLENTERAAKHKVRKILSFGLGFTEIRCYSFYGEEEIKKCAISEEGHFKLKNYLSSDQTHLRTTLTPNLLKEAEKNLKNFDNFKIYEIGRTYKDTGKYFPFEEKGLTALVVQAKKDKSEVFYKALGACETLLEHFGAPKWEIREAHKLPPYAHPKKSAGVYIKDKLIGLIFELHPIVAKAHSFDRKAAEFWLNFTKLVAAGQETKKYQKIPRFPVTHFDVSVLVDERKPIADIEKHISRASELISEVELFDIFTGEGIKKGKKACAFTITLQAEDRTLTDAEMAEVQKKVFENLQRGGGIIRGLNN